MEFTVKRSEWLRGEGSHASRLLRGSDLKKCCVGFYCLAAGIPAEKIIDLASIQAIVSSTQQDWGLPEWTRKYVIAPGAPFGVDDAGVLFDIYDAYFTNDDALISSNIREDRLKAIFARNGDTIIFVD